MASRDAGGGVSTATARRVYSEKPSKKERIHEQSGSATARAMNAPAPRPLYDDNPSAVPEAAPPYPAAGRAVGGQAAQPPAEALAQLRLDRLELSTLVRSCSRRFGYYAADERASPSSVRRLQSEVAQTQEALQQARGANVCQYSAVYRTGQRRRGLYRGHPHQVIEVALDQIAYDWDAAEIHRQYP